MHSLSITRDIPFSQLQTCLFRCWTEPALLEQWFCPKPWRADQFEVELRPGGRFNSVFHGPDGETFPNRGVFLEIIDGEKLVFTSAFQTDWQPADFDDPETLPFVATVTFEQPDSETLRYTARVDHFRAADARRHAEMGFEAGWNAALDQLIELSSRGE